MAPAVRLLGAAIRELKLCWSTTTQSAYGQARRGRLDQGASVSRSLVVLNLGHLNWNLELASTLGTIRSALKSSLRWAQGWRLAPRSSMVLIPKTNNFSQFMSVSSVHELITATNSSQNGYVGGSNVQCSKSLTSTGWFFG